MVGEKLQSPTHIEIRRVLAEEQHDSSLQGLEMTNRNVVGVYHNGTECQIFPLFLSKFAEKSQNVEKSSLGGSCASHATTRFICNREALDRLSSSITHIFRSPLQHRPSLQHRPRGHERANKSKHHRNTRCRGFARGPFCRQGLLPTMQDGNPIKEHMNLSSPTNSLPKPPQWLCSSRKKMKINVHIGP